MDQIVICYWGSEHVIAPNAGIARQLAHFLNGLRTGKPDEFSFDSVIDAFRI